MLNPVYVILITAGVTYIFRFLPMLFMKKPIKNQFIRSFLTYIPYTALSAMIFPSIIFVAGDAYWYVGLIAFIVTSLVALKSKNIFVVAISASLTVFIALLIAGAYA